VRSATSINSSDALAATDATVTDGQRAGGGQHPEATVTDDHAGGQRPDDHTGGRRRRDAAGGRSGHETAGGRTRRYTAAVSWCVALSALLRLRFVFTPLTADEGGFLAIARAWGDGRTLYTQVWVDRPQGLLVVYRIWDDLTGAHTQSVRLLAIVFGAMAVVAAAEVARAVAGPAAGMIAALLVAVCSSAPVLDGFAANGELLSGTLSAVAVAFACRAVRGAANNRSMVVSGVLGAMALSIKQSAFDGLAAVGIWLLLSLLFEWQGRRRSLRALGQLTMGATVVFGALVVQGAMTGWRAWWSAIAGYRVQSRSALVGADWQRLRQTARAALPILGPLVLVALFVAVLALVALVAGVLGGKQTERVTTRRARRPVRATERLALLLPLWLVAATFGFLLGGQFYEHYWITLTFPVAVAAAVLIASIRIRRLSAMLAVIVVVPALVSAVQFITLPRSQVLVEVDGYGRSIKEERVGEWFLHTRTAGDSLYVMCASAAVYAYAHQDPPFPYLWFDNVHLVPGAAAQLSHLLRTPGAQPTYIALFQTPAGCTLDAESRRLLATQYEPFTRVDGVAILVLVDRDA
jgi:hypothetical protein